MKVPRKMSEENVVFRSKLLRIAREQERWGRAFTAITGSKQYQALGDTVERHNMKLILEKHKYDCLKKWVANERMEALTALLNLIFATIEYEYNYEGLRQPEPVIPYASRALLTITTIFTLYFMIVRRYYKYKWGTAVHEDLRLHKALAEKQLGHESILPISTFIEFLITLIQPLPFADYKIMMRAGYPLLDYQFTLSELLYGLMFLKLYIILRYVVSSSVYTNSDAKFLCLVKYDFHANARYAFKCLTKEYPLTFALSLIFGTIFILAVLMRIFERPYRREQLIQYGEDDYQSFETIENAIWCTIITLTTVGYGDFVPSTLGGRICESAACIWGGVVTTLMIVVMINFLSLTKNQKKAFFDLTISDPAALVIGAFFYYVRAKNNAYSIYSDTNQSYRALEKQVIAFMGVKKRAEVVSADIISHEEAIAKKLEARIAGVEKKIDRIVHLLENKGKLNEEEYEEVKV